VTTLLKRGLPLAVLAVLGWIAVRQWLGSNGWAAMRTERDRIRELQEQTSKLESEVQEQRRLNHDLTHDQETIELYIRKVTGKIKKDEVKVMPPSPAPAE
jgi:cell division protein FtsB